MSSRARLLTLLSDREFVTGTDLGLKLGISRAAVHKHIGRLRDSGLPINCVRGRGYRLAPGIVPLDAALMTEYLDASTRAGLNSVYIEQRVNSTNDYLKKLTDINLLHATVCLAEAQSAGRGRHGKRWIASPYRNLMMSMGWKYSAWPPDLSGLAIAVGMVLVDTLGELGVDGLGIKWPNDIVYGEKKLGGILIDVSAEAAGSCSVIVGVGLNVRLTEADGALIDQPWSDLAHGLGCHIDRNRLASYFINALFTLLRRYGVEGFDPYRQRWQRYDVLRGRMVAVTFHRGETQLLGRASGVDSSGGLRVRRSDGTETVCYHGDVSVRRR